MANAKSNPLFTSSEKRRGRVARAARRRHGSLRHKLKGFARSKLGGLLGIPLNRKLLTGKGLRSAAHRSPGAALADRSLSSQTTVRGDVIEALKDQGYSAATARKMAGGVRAGDDFESAFRRVMARNPGELIIFGNPAKVYTRKNVEKAKRAGNPIPAAIIAGFEGALGSTAASALTSGSHRKRNAKKKQTFMPRVKKLMDDAEDLKLAQQWKDSIRTGKDFPSDKTMEEHIQDLRRLKKKRLLNPAALDRAEQLFETFHHRGSSGVYETQRSAKSRKDFTILGPLVAIGINAEQYDQVKRALGKKDWEDYKVEHWDKLPHLAFLSGSQIAGIKRILEEPDKYVKDCPQLASSPNGKQLYAITPDGVEIDLRQFETDVSKDFVDLGEATFVVYVAKKPDRPVEWIHELGEEGGTRPRLVLNRLGKKELFFTGGSYRVEGPGIIN